MRGKQQSPERGQHEKQRAGLIRKSDESSKGGPQMLLMTRVTFRLDCRHR